MKKMIKAFSVAMVASLLLGPVLVNAQDDKDKTKKKDKDGEVEQIIITKTGDKNEKIVVEIKGDKVTVNGKDVNDLKDDDIQVIRNKFKGMTGLTVAQGNGNWKMNWDMGPDGHGPMAFTTVSENRAFLGVTTEKTEEGKGVKVTNVTEESAAKKAGLEAGDIITKIDDTKIESPDDLTKAIRAHKPGDKVKVTYSRDKKEKSTNAELTKMKGLVGNYDWNITAPDVNYREMLRSFRSPEAYSIPRLDGLSGQHFDFFMEDQRLGMSVQDTEDGKGVKVLAVDEESNAAKAGLKEGDVITEFAGKEVNSADEIARLYRAQLKEKVATVPVKLSRNGKAQSLDIKIPRKLKTADL